MFEHLKQLAAIIAPEIERLYIVEKWPEFPAADWVAACADRFRSATVRQHLIDSGQWAGPGDTIIFCKVHPEEYEGILCHELAHLLPVLPPVESLPTPEAIEYESKMLSHWPDLPEEPSGEPWIGHGIDFTRRCLHLWERGKAAGYEIHGATLGVAGQRYGLSHGSYYRKFLADEPERLAGLTFAEIEAIKPPRLFQELFDTDVARWHQQKQEKKIA